MGSITRESVFQPPYPPILLCVYSESTGTRPEWNATLTGRTRRQVRKHIQKSADTTKPPRQTASTCRDEVVQAAKAIVANKGKNEFRPIEIVERLKHSDYPASTIRTHVSSRCCANAPDHHAKVYKDFERIRDGVYRIIVEDE